MASSKQSLEFIKNTILENRRENIGMRGKQQASSAEDDKPLFIRAAESLAKRRGVTSSELLSSISSRLRHSKYPTSDCLSPDEIDEYSHTDEIPSEQQLHISECSFCSALLNAQPDPTSVTEFECEVQTLCAAYKASPWSEPQK